MSRMHLNKPEYIAAGDMSGNVTGGWLDVSSLDSISFLADWIGTPAGNLILQVSNDKTKTVDVTTQAAGGTAGSKRFNLADVGEKWARLIFTHTSSTGTLNVQFHGKGV